MIVYPAIDILDGKCVRLYQGKRERVQVFSDSPVDAAKLWEERGARALHIVDLNGAFDGIQANYKIIEKIAAAISIPIQVGGGVRDMAAIERLLVCGIKKIILGTAAVGDREFLKNAINRCSDNLIVGADARNGKIVTKGWITTENLDILDFARELERLGVINIIYTDISRDGTMEGINHGELEKVCSINGIKVIASGGINSLEDIRLAKALGAEGVISGLALYNGTFTLEAANMV